MRNRAANSKHTCTLYHTRKNKGKDDCFLGQLSRLLLIELICALQVRDTCLSSWIVVMVCERTAIVCSMCAAVAFFKNECILLKCTSPDLVCMCSDEMSSLKKVRAMRAQASGITSNSNERHEQLSLSTVHSKLLYVELKKEKRRDWLALRCVYSTTLAVFSFFSKLQALLPVYKLSQRLTLISSLYCLRTGRCLDFNRNEVRVLLSFTLIRNASFNVVVMIRACFDIFFFLFQSYERLASSCFN